MKHPYLLPLALLAVIMTAPFILEVILLEAASDKAGREAVLGGFLLCVPLLIFPVYVIGEWLRLRRVQSNPQHAAWQARHWPLPAVRRRAIILIAFIVISAPAIMIAAGIMSGRASIARSAIAVLLAVIGGAVTLPLVFAIQRRAEAILAPLREPGGAEEDDVTADTDEDCGRL